ncbi:hypothetical protein ACXN5S_05240 [Pseudoroseicyclus sp. H15]
MRLAISTASILVILAACAPEETANPLLVPPDQIVPLPPEPPLYTIGPDPDREIPQMGTLRGTLEGEPVAWDTYDFSVGAPDGSVQFTDYDVLELSIGGYRPGQPRELSGTISIIAEMAEAAPGRSLAAQVELNGENFADPLFAAPAEVVIESLTRGEPGSPMGTLYGTITATITAPDLCPGTAEPPCNGGLALRLEGEVQYNIPWPEE